MRKTLIAVAVGSIATVAYAGTSSNMEIGRFGAPVSEVTGQTESGPVHSFMGPQVSDVYVSPENPVIVAPVMVGTASAAEELPAIGDSAAASQTWYMPDGSVVQQGPVSLNSEGMTSDDLLASSSWNGMSGAGSDNSYIIAETVQPDYIIVYGE